MDIKRYTKMGKKPLVDQHGASAMYQVWWQEDAAGAVFKAKKPKDMKTFKHFARVTLKPGETNNLHTHKDAEQVYFVMAGEGIAQVGEEKQYVTAGDAIFLPANVPHGFFNTGKNTAVVLMIGAAV
ncbi:cupin domain-containing protein [Candidatus Bathyarchaeota archaeon]|nr:cupin domain-containing protein [Candidatus Bathyarchaeota archaeon]